MRHAKNERAVDMDSVTEHDLRVADWSRRRCHPATCLLISIVLVCVSVSVIERLHLGRRSGEHGGVRAANATATTNATLVTRATTLTNATRPTNATTPTTPRNIIFMVSDGFGSAGITLARDALRRRSGNGSARLNLESFVSGLSETSSANSMVTDSAAGATAWSCAQKTNNLYVGVDTQDRPCGTLMEAAKAAGQLTGIVTMSSVTDATPAAFASHVRRRSLEHSVALQLAKTQTSSELILGGGLRWFRPQGLVEDLAAGRLGDGRRWDVVNGTAAMLDATKLPLLGLFAEDDLPWEIDRVASQRVASQVPSLEQMTCKAIELLAAADTGGGGFFLLVEGASIDKVSHFNDAAAYTHEVLEYDRAVGCALDFARRDRQTLVVSVSDHETGGLSLARGAISGEPKSEPLQYEAPLRTRSFAAEVEGVIDTKYGVAFEALDVVNASAQAVLKRATVALAAEWATETASLGHADPELALLAELKRAPADASLRRRFVRHLVDSLTTATSLELMSHERRLISEAVGFLEQLGTYAVQRALASIVSARARVGWSTWGHTATDVLLHAFGPGSDLLRGTMANSELGARIARMMRWDLEQTTAAISTPAIAPQDLLVEKNKPFASWL